MKQINSNLFLWFWHIMIILCSGKSKTGSNVQHLYWMANLMFLLFFLRGNNNIDCILLMLKWVLLCNCVVNWLKKIFIKLIKDAFRL